MTEDQWLAATDPTPMLEFLRSSGRASDRKLRLFAAACCRRFLALTNDHRIGEAVDIAERFADGLVGDEERSRARKAAQQAAQVRGVVARPDAPKWQRRAASLAYYTTARHATEAAWNVPGLAVEILVRRGGGFDLCDWQAIKAEGRVLCNLLRDIFGHLPFRPVTLDPSLLKWHDGTVVRLAQAGYEQRSLPDGRLDNSRLAVLADAREEAGCQNDEVLRHLREQDGHWRGCWVLDLLLNKR
jgi:hypothetical protein